ncbi:MAG TPA: DUF2628 domain-containing protein, partial [Candidatus Deferrimicrobiaceae bacterium]
MFCPACGREGRSGASYCEGCGRPLASGEPPRDPAGPAEGWRSAAAFPAEADIVCFVGEKSGYYLGKFRSFQVGRMEAFAPTWNWSAFLFGAWWFLYRKMYLWALGAFFLTLVPALGFLAHIACGIVGNYLYYRHAGDRIREAAAANPAGSLPPVLAQLGGVNG